jgi:CubicO group peptidase (beta-lactamase class C family)
MRHAIRRRLALVVLLLACSSPAWPQAATPPDPAASAAPLAADTPHATPRGNTFVAPAGWTIVSSGDAVKLEAPEPGSWLALVDVDAPDAAAAVAEAWRRLVPGFQRTLRVAADAANRDTWTGRRTFDYETSPNEHRTVFADARRANGTWTVVLGDLAQEVEEKRASQVGQLLGKLLPRGYTRESFAGRTAHVLDPARVAALRDFVARAMKQTGVPGVSFGLLQGGRVVWEGGAGVRQLGKPAAVDARTRFMVASNTKAMVTLMLARLVDQGKLRWDDPVATLWPTFRLGSDETTRKVLVKHLICACTGMPRQDVEWLLEYAPMTPGKVMDLLATMEPTSGFGELFQYSNTMASAAGYLGAHMAYPDRDLGAGYDAAMQRLVFDPLGMRDTTHDFDLAERGNAAVPHSPDIDNRPRLAPARVNRAVVPMRPAGGVWSTTHDMLKYVAMELAQGRLPGGAQLLSMEVLLARRAPQVAAGDGVTYGMGLMVDTEYGTPVVHHGGDMIGFHSDMMWLPEHDVGAVILTNGDPGWIIRSVFRRKLLEVLFDGRPEADEAMAARAKAFFDDRLGTRKLLKVPADPQAAASLAPHYHHAAIGDVTVRRGGSATVFDFGEWRSEVASKANPDGTTSMVTIAPGVDGFEFVMGREGGQRTLTLRDGQHTYVMVER